MGTKSVATGNGLPQELWTYKMPGRRGSHLTVRVKWLIGISKNERSHYPDKNQRLNIIIVVNYTGQWSNPVRCFRNNYVHKHKKFERKHKITFRKFAAWGTDLTITVLYRHTYIYTYICAYMCVCIYI